MFSIGVISELYCGVVGYEYLANGLLDPVMCIVKYHVAAGMHGDSVRFTLDNIPGNGLCNADR